MKSRRSLCDRNTHASNGAVRPARRATSRGEAENRIKETQLDLFGTRGSCREFLANWLRILFSALAYTLMQRLREMALQDADLVKATAATIRVSLLKIGATVIRNTRRIRILLASHHPLRDIYLIAANALASP
jgi:hypothetical protein